MSRVNIPRNAFVSGEISPRLLGRDDLPQYSQGCVRLTNMFVTPHGGAFSRHGSKFVAPAKSSTSNIRLLTFEYSTEQTYIVELGDKYARFFSRGAQLLDGGAPVEIETPWSSTEVWGLSCAQSADVLYIAHVDHPIYKLRRLTTTTFDLVPVVWSRSRAPLGVFNLDPDNYIVTNAEVLGDTTVRTITMAKDTFTSGDIGRAFYIRDVLNAVAVYYTITALSPSQPATTATMEIGHAVIPTGGSHPSGTTADRWALGVMSSTEGARAISFVEGRLAIGGFKRFPDMLWLSASDDFENFEIESPDAEALATENASRAIQRRTVGGQVNTVLWMCDSASRFTVGTAGGMFTLDGGSEGVLTPTSATVRRLTLYGSSPQAPVVVDTDPLFVTRNNAGLRSLSYSLEADSVVTENTSILCEHLFSDGGILDLARQSDPDSIVWAATGSGALVGVTIEKQQKVVAGHRHILGGSYEGGPPIVESVAVVPGAAAHREEAIETGAEDAAIGLENPGGEAGDVSGWSATGSWASVESGDGLIPTVGSRMLRCSGDGTLVQSVDLNEIDGISLSLIDEGLTEVTFTGNWARASDLGVLNVTLSALSAAGAVLSVLYDGVRAGLPQPDPATWGAFGGTFLLPRSCRGLRVTLSSAVGAAGAYFDGVSGILTQGPRVAGGGGNTGDDQIWLVVRRTISGAPVRYIEVLVPRFASELTLSSTTEERRAASDGAKFLDSYLEYRAAVGVTDIRAGTPVTVVAPAHGLSTGDIARLRGLVGDFAGLNYLRVRVTRLNDDEVSLLDPYTAAPVALEGSYIYSSGADISREISQVSGLGHLEGETVVAFGDGGVLGHAVVSGGAIELPRAASRVVVGLPYDRVLETTPMFGGSRTGGAQRAPRRVCRIGIRLLDSVGGRVSSGPNPTIWERIESATYADRTGLPPPLFTGQVDKVLPGKWSPMTTVVINQDVPLPFTVLAVYPEVEFDES